MEDAVRGRHIVALAVCGMVAFLGGITLWKKAELRQEEAARVQFGKDLTTIGFVLMPVPEGDQNPYRIMLGDTASAAAIIEHRGCRVVLDQKLHSPWDKEVKGIEMTSYGLGWLLDRDYQEVKIDDLPELDYPTPEDLSRYFRKHPGILEKCVRRN